MRLWGGRFSEENDERVAEFTRSIEDDPNAGSSWTPYSPRLDRKLFKGGANGSA